MNSSDTKANVNVNMNVNVKEENEMTITEFANEVVKEMQTLGYDAEVKTVEKANGVKLTGIFVKDESSSITPIIYIDDAFKSEVSIKETVQTVVENYKEYKAPNYLSDLDYLTQYDAVKERLRIRLYNEATKKGISRSAREFGFDDLILVPVIEVSKTESEETATITVREDLVDKWNLTVDEVIDQAIENTKANVEYELLNFGDFFGDFMPGLPAMGSIQILTNKNKICGAFGVIAMKDELEENFPEGYVVIPSSIHEVLVGDIREFDNIKALADIICEVNETAVLPEEVLGNKPYVFECVA